MFKMLCVFDSKAEAYLNPIFCSTNAVGIRSFAAAAVDPQSDFCRHPADYTLFELGTWCPQTGVFVILETKVSLGSALEFKSAAQGVAA